MSATQTAHVSNTFHLVIRVPLSRAATLFGAEAERCWAGPEWQAAIEKCLDTLFTR